MYRGPSQSTVRRYSFYVAASGIMTRGIAFARDPEHGREHLWNGANSWQLWEPARSL